MSFIGSVGSGEGAPSRDGKQEPQPPNSGGEDAQFRQEYWSRRGTQILDQVSKTKSLPYHKGSRDTRKRPDRER